MLDHVEESVAGSCCGVKTLICDYYSFYIFKITNQGLVFVLVGCVISYEPRELGVELSPGESQTFTAEISETNGWVIIWTLDGVEVAEGPNFTYTAEQNQGTEMILHRLRVQTWKIPAFMRRFQLYAEPWSDITWYIMVLGSETPYPCGMEENFGPKDYFEMALIHPAPRPSAHISRSKSTASAGVRS